MLSEILTETLIRLEEYEKQHPEEIKSKKLPFNSLKREIRYFRDYWAMPSQLEQIENL